MEPVAYLTCEIKGRDFRSRMLIAAHLVKRGYSVILGQYWNLIANVRYAPKGVFLFKTANKIQVEGMRVCKKYGHTVVASDEEALSTSEALATHTTDPETFQYCDAYLAINPGHARALSRAYPGRAFPVVGTARADLLRTARYARPHPKPYALLNTSFGMTNSVWGDVGKAAAIYAKGRGWNIDTPEHRAFMAARIEYERRALTETKSLLSWLVQSSDLDVIVRPHPNEKLAIWDMPGVSVVQNSDPSPWLKHAHVMVHNDSTLGLEAAIMGAPALNLSPADTWASRLNVRKFNETVHSSGDAIQAISTGRVGCERDTSDLAPFDAAEKFAGEIAKLLPPPRSFTLPAWGSSSRVDVQKKKITVTVEECLEATNEIFPIAGAKATVSHLTDTVFMFQP